MLVYRAIAIRIATRILQWHCIMNRASGFHNRDRPKKIHHPQIVHMMFMALVAEY